MLYGLTKLFRRKKADATKKPDRMLDWADPVDRSEGIMRHSYRSSEAVAKKMFEEFPPTLGILQKSEELKAMAYAIQPMFIHVAMDKMYSQWDKRHKFVKTTAFWVAQRYTADMHRRKTDALKRMYPLLRTMEEEAAVDMIEKLLERFDHKIRIYDGTRTQTRDADRSTFHRMGLHVASQFYMERHRRAAQEKLVQVAMKEAGQFSRRI